MRSLQHSVFARPDTLLGVCEALGEDLRFNPLLLRIALAVALIWQPVGVLCVYAAAGLVVALSRLLFPSPLPPSAAPLAADGSRDRPAADERPEVGDEPIDQPLPLAA